MPIIGRRTNSVVRNRIAWEGGFEAIIDHALAAIDADPRAMSKIPSPRRSPSYRAFAAPNTTFAAPLAKPSTAGQRGPRWRKAVPVFVPKVTRLTKPMDADAEANGPVTQVSGVPFASNAYSG